MIYALSAAKSILFECFAAAACCSRVLCVLPKAGRDALAIPSLVPPLLPLVIMRLAKIAQPFTITIRIRDIFAHHTDMCQRSLLSEQPTGEKATTSRGKLRFCHTVIEIAYHLSRGRRPTLAALTAIT